MYNFNMLSIRSLCNEFAAAVTGFHGAIAGAKIGAEATMMLMAAAGVSTGIVPGVVVGAALLGGAAIGGTIAYVGTKQLLSWLADDRLQKADHTTRRAPRRAGPPRSPALQPPAAAGSRRLTNMLEQASDFGRAVQPARKHLWHRAGFDM